MIRTAVIERWSSYRRWMPTDVYRWAKALLLAGIAVAIAQLFWAVVSPVGPLGEWKAPRARTLAPAVQQAVLAVVDPFFRGGAGPVGAAAAAIDVKLFGIRGEGLGGGAAIIGTPDGAQESFSVGQDVAPGVKLVAVHFDYVVLDRGGGQQQRLFLDQDKASEMVASAPAAPSSTAPAASLAEGAGSLSVGAMREAFNFAPRAQGGRISGISVLAGADAASFAASGFRPGDVIVAVNGARINSSADVAQLQTSIAPGARLLLTVERGSETVPIALNVAGGS
ncbi:type II secretion system protein N [Sphingomonas sp. LY160]|uniref:type II secretion system protein N n=1 Tax=Sphingomonas sp. LY160 TaxID=3095342 RepID=UPI002ADEEA2E|nr:type II secretion system protein N [Sphingomonas sp. LY160]MEA1072869.1 type II secretion system protein N [Sphingomonas sp. LY160]